MRARRELIRTVVPPLLALGLVALLVRPVEGAPPRLPAVHPSQPTATVVLTAVP